MTLRTTLFLGTGVLVIAAACEQAARSSSETQAATAKPAATAQQAAKPAVPPPNVPVPESPPAAADAHYPTNPSAMPRVPVAEAAALREAGKAVIVDVRDQAAYEHNHIAGALNIPLAELPQRLSELPRDKRVLTYCA